MIIITQVAEVYLMSMAMETNKIIILGIKDFR